MPLGLRRAVPAGGRIFRFRETDVYNRTAVAANGVDHLRQAMERLRPENNIDVVGALANMVTFLRGDTTADANNQVGILLFQ